MTEAIAMTRTSKRSLWDWKLLIQGLDSAHSFSPQVAGPPPTAPHTATARRHVHMHMQGNEVTQTHQVARLKATRKQLSNFSSITNTCYLVSRGKKHDSGNRERESEGDMYYTFIYGNWISSTHHKLCSTVDTYSIIPSSLIPAIIDPISEKSTPLTN